ncbi:MAG: ferritin-like protein [Flavipsychrobacter sp.]|jgi:ferritin-like metal-binding protein YciE|nr:ferritin-like protein [Flavipsychrobacter sp.]
MRTSTKKATTSRSNTGTAKKSTATNGQKKKAPGNTKTSKQQQTTPFEKLFEDLLKDVYWAEQALVGALQKMSQAATTDELQSALEDHKFVTQKHISRLDRVFALLGKKPEGKKCDAMAGLIKEGEHVVEETPEGTMTRDAGLIIAAQKVEHYEIAAYGSLVQVALTLGHNQAAYLLEKTLLEEEYSDYMLTEIAETMINPMADSEDETSGEEVQEEELAEEEA